MKKVLLALAFTGLLAGSAFAGEPTKKGDDKDKKAAKKECCKKEGDTKACAGEKKETTCTKGETSCCKKKQEGTTATAAADTKVAEQPKK